MSEEIQRVAVAVVEHNGRYLVGTRAKGKALAGYAEFPGGKCLPDEDSAACAVRECREETGLQAIAVRLVHACRHSYLHGTLDIEFWLCRPDVTGGPLVVQSGYEWTTAEALKSLRFPEANHPVIEQITARPPSAS
jgi:8-oxo-dGTP diphosphatase